MQNVNQKLLANKLLKSFSLGNLTTSRPFLASFKQIFKLLCTSAYAKRNLIPELSVIKVLPSFSNLIWCFVNDGLILTPFCVIAFLLKFFFLNQRDLKFMMVFCVLFFANFSNFVEFIDVVIVISSLDIPISLNVSKTSLFTLFKFSFYSLHNSVKRMQDLLEYIPNIVKCPNTYAASFITHLQILQIPN